MHGLIFKDPLTEHKYDNIRTDHEVRICSAIIETKRNIKGQLIHNNSTKWRLKRSILAVRIEKDIWPYTLKRQVFKSQVF